MYVIWLIVFYFIGMFTVAFGGTQIVTTLTVSIPITNSLKKANFILDNAPYTKICFTLILWLAIVGTVCWSIFTFATEPMVIGFVVGLAITFLTNIGQFGKNNDNISDWVASIASSLNPEFSIADLNNFLHIK